MKYVLLMASLIFALSSCASIPVPKKADDSLVIGHLVLDFPDGFFDQPGRTIESGVMLHLVNTTEQTRFSLLTSGGYFRFLSHGADEYLLKGYEFSKRETGVVYYMSDEINQKILTQPKKVVYLGHITIRYTQPRISNKVSIGQATTSREFERDADRSQENFSMLRSLRQTYAYWDFERYVDRSFETGALIQYLKQKNPGSPWLNYEILQ